MRRLCVAPTLLVLIRVRDTGVGAWPWSDESAAKVEGRMDGGKRAPCPEKASMGGWTREGALWEVKDGSTKRWLLWCFYENDERSSGFC